MFGPKAGQKDESGKPKGVGLKVVNSDLKGKVNIG